VCVCIYIYIHIYVVALTPRLMELKRVY
jgi:hypothetical protein